MHQNIRSKRIQDPATDADGYRVLVDRIWPRGIRKADARLDAWMKALAPSSDLRKWFGHDPARWEAFQEAYKRELAQVPEALNELLSQARQGPVTLLYSARDRQHNQAVVLAEVLDAELRYEESPNEPASPTCYGNPGEAQGRS